jgi:hypothetical protein
MTQNCRSAKVVRTVVLGSLLTVANPDVFALTGGQLPVGPPSQRTVSGRPEGSALAPGCGPGAPGTTLRTGSTAWEWWNDAAVQKDLGLRPEQSARITAIYNRRGKDIEGVVEDYKAEKAAVDKMLSDRAVDESQLS